MSFIITSYYTVFTPYQGVAHKYLMSSLEGRNLKTDIRGVESLGSWQKNTSYKARFLWEMLNKHPEDNIVFLDVDAEILEYPELFEKIPEGYFLAAHILDRNNWYQREYGIHRYELLSGTLWLKNCSETKNLLLDWIDRVEKSTLWEQKVLHQIIKEKNIQIFELPLDYCYINSLPNGNEPFIKLSKPIIKHNQVSRKLKSQIK